MKETYYDLPIRFDLLMQKNRELPTCSLDKSIAQNIFLIITSKFNEHRFDPTYGCEIWETDFELIHNYVANRNVNISQTVTKQIVISSKKYPTKIPTDFEEISSSKGAPGILLDLQRFKFLNILCV